MKILVLVSTGLVLTLAACGSDGGRSGETASSAQSSAGSAQSGSDSPVIHLPSGPPPRKTLSKDLVKGKGPAIPPIANRPLVSIAALYKAVDYRTGKVVQEIWDPREPFEIDFGRGLEVWGWEVGLIGMREGGTRELIVPSRMAYEEGALVYVVHLLRVKKINSQA